MRKTRVKAMRIEQNRTKFKRTVETEMKRIKKIKFCMRKKTQSNEDRQAKTREDAKIEFKISTIIRYTLTKGKQEECRESGDLVK